MMPRLAIPSQLLKPSNTHPAPPHTTPITAPVTASSKSSRLAPPPVPRPRIDRVVSDTSTNMSTVPSYRNTPSSPYSSRKAVKSSATSSAPSSRPPTRSDPFYGHEEIAVLCARFITSLFACPNLPTGVAPGSPTPTLAHFVAYALHRTRLPPIVTFAALLLLQRLKTRFPAARGSSGHRLFISAFMIASKVICDDTYSNQSWGIVAQKMFALKEINQMEREMCGYLEWNLNVQGPEILDFEQQMRMEHGPRAVVAMSKSSSSSSSSEMAVPIVATPVPVYPTPDTTPDTSSTRPIRPVRSKPSYRNPHYAQGLPSPPTSPQYRPSPAGLSPPVPTFLSASSSLQSSPASEDCKTPSPVSVGAPSTSQLGQAPKSVNMTRWPSDPRYMAAW